MNDATRPDITTLSTDFAFYVSLPHDCSYLEERESVTLYADPHAELDMALYSDLAELGFRRSGSNVYRPNCPHCNACTPTRVDSTHFTPNRSQRRCLMQGGGLEVTVTPARFDEAHYQLYRRYIGSRHSDGSMDGGDSEQYCQFLIAPWADSQFIEFRHHGMLVAVAVTDCLRTGLSSVYTFYDPDFQDFALGGYAILWQLAECQRRGLPWLFLGYLIHESPKMAYKAHYLPQQQFREGLWRTVTKFNI